MAKYYCEYCGFASDDERRFIFRPEGNFCSESCYDDYLTVNEDEEE